MNAWLPQIAIVFPALVDEGFFFLVCFTGACHVSQKPFFVCFSSKIFNRHFHHLQAFRSITQSPSQPTHDSLVSLPIPTISNPLESTHESRLLYRKYPFRPTLSISSKSKNDPKCFIVDSFSLQIRIQTQKQDEDDEERQHASLCGFRGAGRGEDFRSKTMKTDNVLHFEASVVRVVAELRYGELFHIDNIVSRMKNYLVILLLS